MLRNLTELDDTCRVSSGVSYGSCKQAISMFSYSSTAFLHHTNSLGNSLGDFYGGLGQLRKETLNMYASILISKAQRHAVTQYPNN
jgi:hypothetical protein